MISLVGTSSGKGIIKDNGTPIARNIVLPDAVNNDLDPRWAAYNFREVTDPKEIATLIEVRGKRYGLKGVLAKTKIPDRWDVMPHGNVKIEEGKVRGIHYLVYSNGPTMGESDEVLTLRVIRRSALGKLPIEESLLPLLKDEEIRKFNEYLEKFKADQTKIVEASGLSGHASRKTAFKFICYAAHQIHDVMKSNMCAQSQDPMHGYLYRLIFGAEPIGQKDEDNFGRPAVGSVTTRETYKLTPRGLGIA